MSTGGAASALRARVWHLAKEIRPIDSPLLLRGALVRATRVPAREWGLHDAALVLYTAAKASCSSSVTFHLLCRHLAPVIAQCACAGDPVLSTRYLTITSRCGSIGVTLTQNMQVRTVVRGGPAAGAGLRLRRGSVVYLRTVDGEEVQSPQEVSSAISCTGRRVKVGFEVGKQMHVAKSVALAVWAFATSELRDCVEVAMGPQDLTSWQSLDLSACMWGLAAVRGGCEIFERYLERWWEVPVGSQQVANVMWGAAVLHVPVDGMAERVAGSGLPAPHAAKMLWALASSAVSNISSSMLQALQYAAVEPGSKRIGCTLWALAILRGTVELPHSAARLPPDNLAEVVYAMGKAQSSITSLPLPDRPTPFLLATLMWAMARLQGTPPHLTYCLSALPAAIPSLTPVHIASILSGMAVLQSAPQDLVASLFSRAEDLAPCFTGPTFSRTLLSAGRISHTPKSFVLALCPRVISDPTFVSTPHDISTLLCAFSYLAATPSEDLVDVLNIRLVDTMSAAKGRDIAMALTAMVRLELRCEVVLSAVAHRIDPSEGLTTKEAALILSAFGFFAYRPAGVVQALTQAVFAAGSAEDAESITRLLRAESPSRLGPRFLA